MYLTFVTHSMISSKYVGSTVVLEIVFQNVVNPRSNTINNLDIVEINVWIRFVCVPVRVAPEQVQEYDEIVLLKQSLWSLVFIGSIKQALKLLKRPLVQKRGICIVRNTYIIKLSLALNLR